MGTKYQEEITGDSNANTTMFQQNTKETFLDQQQDSSSEWTKMRNGSFWIRYTKKGVPYLSGLISIDGKEVPIHIHKNQYQEGKQPHFYAYRLNH